MTGVEKVAEYLEKAKIFYLLTAEDGKPSGRPFTFFSGRKWGYYFLDRAAQKGLSTDEEESLCGAFGFRCREFYEN